MKRDNRTRRGSLPITHKLADTERSQSHNPRADVGAEGGILHVKKHIQRRTLARGLQEDAEAEPETLKAQHLRPSTKSRRLPPKADPLSKDNLRLFNEVMDPGTYSIPLLKRTSSRRSIGTSEPETVRSQRSSNTAAYYRYKGLAAADIIIHADPPDDIQAVVDRIVNAEISDDRRDHLRDISIGFHRACKETVKAAAGEDDFIDILYTALKAMSTDTILFRAKADWREELKPVPPQLDLDLSFLGDLKAIESRQGGPNDTSAPPPKRQQQSTSQTYISPQSSSVDAVDSTPDDRPPADTAFPISRPSQEKPRESYPIKTPRPDLSIGLKETAVFMALSRSRNGTVTWAKRFLEKLENTRVSSERDGLMEPLLVTIPTQRASDLVFPFAVVEGKAYSTGKQVFEAQNQAAVSGASALKIQLSLNELTKRSTSTDALDSPSKEQAPLFFSICTEGPSHELWAHYTHIEDDFRKFNMKLLKICNGILLEGVEDFIIAVDNVLRWGTGPFLESVVERLGKVAKKTGV